MGADDNDDNDSDSVNNDVYAVTLQQIIADIVMIAV